VELFLDTSRLAEIEKWLAHGVVDGVTTNPTILLKDGQRDLETAAQRIAALIHPRPLSVEVLSSEPAEMLRQARLFARWAENIVVKITVVDQQGQPLLRVVHELEADGIRVNCTACLSFGQAMLAAKAGASYVSLFVGRIDDEGHDGAAVIRQTRQWLDAWGSPAKLIAGSMRGTVDVQKAALAGAHVVTVPPEILSKLVDHRYSRATVQQFLEDGQQALTSLHQLQP
jgi:transaldolase